MRSSTGRLTLPIACLLALQVPGHAAPVRRISFLNDVVPALTRAGCNQGTCHGAAAGKNGFKLTLRGYAPELDYDAITRQGAGRRLCLPAPERSLLIRKPTLALPHRGGLALRPGSPEKRVLIDWISQGAPGPDARDPHLVRLDVVPRERSVSPRATLPLHVLARLSDGTTRDVTYWSRFASNDENVATVAPGGLVRMSGEGETAITVAYQDRVATARVAVPFPNAALPPAGSPSAQRLMPPANYIDDLVYAKLAALHLVPSPGVADGAFCRRLYMDLIGTLPTEDEVRRFTADRRPDRRKRLVEALMTRAEFVDFWTYRWCDLLRVNRGMLKDKGMWSFYAWVRDCVAANKPWDRMAREVLTASGNTFLDGPANYFRTALKPEELAENVSQGFLGIRVQCARCHNHPLEKWTQNDYYGMANLFARVGRKANYDVWVNDEMTVYEMPTGDVPQPRLGHPLPPKPLGGPAMASTLRSERRRFFADWLTRPENPYFARSTVNRVWAHFMGRGLVEPVDDLRETNPPTNPALLDALTADFVRHRYDLRHLMRTILASRTYQLASVSVPGNRRDDRYYSRYYVRRLSAEQLLDALSQVTGQPEPFADTPSGVRAIQLPDTHIRSEFMDSFGRPARQVTCECERSQEPGMGQALLFINGDAVNRKLAAPGGLIDRALAANPTDTGVLRTLFWAALGRDPDPAEGAAMLAALRRPDNRAPEARHRRLEDLLWALLNSKEFLFNH